MAGRSSSASRDARNPTPGPLKAVAADDVAPAPLTLWDAVRLPSLRNLTFALLVAVLAAAVAAVAVLTRPAEYQSRAILEIHQPGIFADSGPGTILKLGGLRNKYAALATTQPIVQPVADKLKIPAGEVAAAVSVTMTPDSLLLFPTATAGDAKQAKAIAQRLSDRLAAYAKAEQDADKVPAERQVRLQAIQKAGDAQKVSPETSRALVVALIVGAAALTAAYVLLQVVTAGRRTGR